MSLRLGSWWASNRSDEWLQLGHMNPRDERYTCVLGGLGLYPVRLTEDELKGGWSQLNGALRPRGRPIPYNVKFPRLSNRFHYRPSSESEYPDSEDEREATYALADTTYTVSVIGHRYNWLCLSGSVPEDENIPNLWFRRRNTFFVRYRHDLLLTHLAPDGSVPPPYSVRFEHVEPEPPNSGAWSVIETGGLEV